MPVTKETISVIIANYNNAPFLDEAIWSVRKQTYEALEIIVCDDASSDDSRAIIMRHAKEDHRIVPLFNERNTGVSATRHKAILNASGTYITTLDSDDYYCSTEKIAEEYGVLKRHATEHAITFSGIEIVDINGRVSGAWQPELPLKEGELLECFLSRNCRIPRDFLLPKHAYFDVGGYELTRENYEDWDLKLRLSKAYRFYFTGTVGIAYRRKGYGLSYKPQSELNRAMEEVFEKNIHLVDDTDRHGPIRAEFLRRISAY